MNRSRSLFYFFCGIFITLLCAVYSNHFNNPFHFDDDHTIVSNQFIRDIHNIPLFFKDARTTSSLPANQAYRPGLTTLNAIDCWIGGKGEPVPLYFHISIFTSYIILGILLYFFILKILVLSSPHRWNNYFALFITAFFMLHAANAETINYIIARSDSFSTLMILAAFVLWQYKPLWRKFGIYLLPVLLGFFVKEPVLMFAPLLFFYLLFFEYDVSLPGLFSNAGLKKATGALMQIIPSLLLAVLLFWLSAKMTPATWVPGNGNTLTDRILYLQTQAFVMVHYFNNFIFPVNLSADTDWTLITSHFDDRVLTGLGFIVIMLCISFFTSRNSITRPVAYGILWFFIALFPTSSIFPFAEVLNDHRTFFPYIGLALAVGQAVSLLVMKFEKNNSFKTAIAVFASIILIAHAAGAHHRNKVWSSSESLWYDVTVKSPNNARGMMNYGNSLMAKGQYKEALDYFQRAQKIWPAYSYVYINIAILKNATGLTKEAEDNFKYALSLNSINPECYYYYAQFLQQYGRIAEAKQVTQQGLRVSPAHLNLQALKKQLDELPEINNNTSKLDLAIVNANAHPSPENYLELSLQYYLAGDYKSCISAAEEALKLKPDYDAAYNNICSAYNMLRDWDKAIAAGKKAVELNPSSQLAKNNLTEAVRQKELWLKNNK